MEPVEAGAAHPQYTSQELLPMGPPPRVTQAEADETIRRYLAEPPDDDTGADFELDAEGNPMDENGNVVEIVTDFTDLQV